jgi:hypothetical protein
MILGSVSELGNEGTTGKCAFIMPLFEEALLMDYGCLEKYTSKAENIN